MLSTKERQQIVDQVSATVRTSQIIAIAMIVSPLIFAAYVLLLAPEPAAGEGTLTLTVVMAVVAASAVGARLVVAPMVVQTSVQQLRRVPEGNAESALQSDAKQLAALFQTRTIINMALLEGAAFVNLMAYLIERHAVSLGITAALLVVRALSSPTKDRVVAWIEKQLLVLRQQRTGF